MTRLFLIPLAALLFVLPALPAAARHDGHRDHHRAEFRCDDDLQRDARRLETQTFRLLKRARHRLDHPSRGERKALNRLARLYYEARDFREATESHRRLRPMVADYRELSRAFDRAERRFRKLHPDRKMRKQIRKMRASVRDIDERFDPVIARIEHRKERRHARKHARHGDWRWEVAWR